MNTTPEQRNREAQPVHPGVYANPQGGHTVHLKLNDRVLPVLGGLAVMDELSPTGTPTLVGIIVFEDCIALALEGGHTILVHVSDPQAKGTALRFYHANGRLWRVVPLEQLNPGWVSGCYVFRGDLKKFAQRLARIRSRPARPPHHQRPTFWATGGWTGAMVYIATRLVWRVEEWQHSPLTTPQVVTPDAAQALDQYPPDVHKLLTLQKDGVQKTTYQLGGLTLVLTYVERIGLAAAVNRYCPRDAGIPEGTVMIVLVINRLLAPCALSNMAEWVRKTGLHLLLGIPDPELLNYDPRGVSPSIARYTSGCGRRSFWTLPVRRPMRDGGSALCMHTRRNWATQQSAWERGASTATPNGLPIIWPTWSAATRKCATCCALPSPTPMTRWR